MDSAGADHKSTQEMRRKIFEKKLKEGHAVLEVTADQQMAYLTFERTTANDCDIKELLRKCIDQAQISYGIIEEALQKAAQQLCQPGDKIENLAIAQGELSRSGANGSVEILVEAELEVEPGTPLVRIKPPESGSEGYNVFGKLIKTKPGAVKRFHPGKNVISDSDKQLLLAEKGGRVFFSDDTVMVREIYRIVISEDKLTATLSYFENAEIKPEDLLKLLQKAKVLYGIDKAVLAQITTDIRNPETQVQERVVATGKAPKPGRDGKIEFLIHVSEQPRYQADEKGNIDFHYANLIDNVVVGQELAKLIPPVQGEPGRNICDEEIPVKPVFEAKLTPDANVQVSADGIVFSAKIAGQARLTDSILSVTNIYVVDGDVDFSVGSIIFNGTVKVNGNVLDTFNITATDNVVVQGHVGACHIKSLADIQITGGAQGHGKCHLEAEGSISAKFLDDVHVSCQGDVIVGNEILNCRVRSMGKVKIPDGTIVGGKITAFKGIEATAIGSNLGVGTTISAGTDFRFWGQRKKIQREMSVIQASINRIEDISGPLLKQPENFEQLTDKQKSVLKELSNRVEVYHKQYDALVEYLTQLPEEMTTGAIREIHVRKKLHAGVCIKMGGFNFANDKEFSSPVVVKLVKEIIADEEEIHKIVIHEEKDDTDEQEPDTAAT